MADDKESDVFSAARTPPPREATALSPLVRRLIAHNESAYTFNGTCTYILGRGRVAVVDPGPADDRHFAAILAATEGERIETILITHTHRDHSPLAARLRAETRGSSAPFPTSPVAAGKRVRSHDHDYAPDATLAARTGARIVGATFPRAGVHRQACAERGLTRGEARCRDWPSAAWNGRRANEDGVLSRSPGVW